jgi:hypothetical protein
VAVIALPRISVAEAKKRFPIRRRESVDSDDDHGAPGSFRASDERFGDLGGCRHSIHSPCFLCQSSIDKSG